MQRQRVSLAHLETEVVPEDVQHSGHLREDEDLVPPFQQGVDHLVKDTHLAAAVYDLLIDLHGNRS